MDIRAVLLSPPPIFQPGVRFIPNKYPEKRDGMSRNKALENHFENPGIVRPREDEITSLECVSSERGTASSLESNLEHNFYKDASKGA